MGFNPWCTLNESRIHNRWPVAREGIPFIGIAVGLTLLFAWWGITWAAVLTGLVALFVIFFFRDPERAHTASPGAVLSPADGTILHVLRLTDGANPLGQPALKVSIFMSVFNVHVNRIPAEGIVTDISYHPGKFFSANLDKASTQNESNRITLETPDAARIVVIQIAGLIARRIACWIRPHDRVGSGQRFGLIRFGSRLEVFIPDGGRITVRHGQKVKAGETVIGYLS